MTLASYTRLKNAKAFTRADIIIAVVLALIIAAAIMYAFMPVKKGSSVIVTVNGESTSYSLDIDRTIDLQHLTVVIESGKVFVKDSDCTDKLCEKTGKIDMQSKSIVCLPNRVVIKIVNASDRLDGVS